LLQCGSISRIKDNTEILIIGGFGSKVSEIITQYNVNFSPEDAVG